MVRFRLERLAIAFILGNYSAGTMFELVKELKDGAEELNLKSSNPISLNAGCELFIEFITLFPHSSAVSININVS